MQKRDTQHLERRYHMVAWLTPILPTMIPLVTNNYKPAGAWCWIDTEETGMRFGLWYVPMLLLITAVGVTYWRVRRAVKKSLTSWQGSNRQEVEEDRSLLRQQVAPLMIYPVVYLGTSIFATINRIQNAIDPSHPVFVLYFLHALTSPAQGFINSLVYGLKGGFWKNCSFSGIKRAWHHRIAGSGIREYPIIVQDTYDPQDWTLSSDEEDESMAYAAPGHHHPDTSWEP